MDAMGVPSFLYERMNSLFIFLFPCIEIAYVADICH